MAPPPILPNMDQQFQPGDIVVLKCGGQIMTVADVDGDGDVVCVWHTRKGKHTYHRYGPPLLKKLSDDADHQQMVEISRLKREVELLHMRAQVDQLRTQAAGITRAMPRIGKA